MAFSLGNGLSEMGKSIAETAGTEAVNAQKADLERQSALLSDQLATTRETNLESLRQSGEIANTKLQQQGAKDLIPLQTAGQIAVADAQTRDQIQAHITEAASDTKEAISKVKQMATPDMLAAQHAITAASTIPNLQLQVSADGTAATFNPESGKVTPLVNNGMPVKFQNPALAQAVVQQTNALKDTGNNLDRMFKADMDAARVLHKDDSPEDQAKAVAEVQDYYRPKVEAVNSQLMSLTSALGVKTGMGDAGAPPANAPPLSSFVKPPVGSTPPSSASFLNGSTP